MEKPLILCTTLLIETSPQALPLGAACIASALKNDDFIAQNFNVELKAFSKEDKNFCTANCVNSTPNTAIFIAENIIQIAKKSNATLKYVGFSVFVWNRNELAEAAKILKERFPNITTFAGGPEITANPQSFSAFDYCIKGPGEKIVPELIKLLEKTGKKEQAKKLVQERVFQTEVENLSSPYLDGTLDPAEYGGALWELARGCPFKCSYCYESKGEKKIRYFPMQRIEKELELFSKKKINQVFVLDPTYNADRTRAKMILQKIAQKAPGIFFYFEARAEFLDRELAKAFTKIPCALQFGLQSSNPEVLKLVNRTFDKKLFTKNIGILNQEGVIFGFDLIYGLPGDTFEGFKKSIDFALNLYPNNLETFCLSVLPGTTLAEEAISLGLDFQKNAPYHVIKSKSFSQKEIEKSEELSHACNVFYNQGRAVPWFISICKVCHKRPVVLLEDFSKWYSQTKEKNEGKSLAKIDTLCLDHKTIEKLQIEFIKTELQSFYLVAENIIRINGALSRVESDGKPQYLSLDFHPDDLMSQFACDLKFFAQNAKKYKCKVKCFKGKNGTDWAIEK